MIHFDKPLNEDYYLNGIIRSSNVITRASSNYNKDVTGKTDMAIIKDKYENYWHSTEDSTYQQYVQIIFPYDKILVESYMFSTGNNHGYFSKSYTLSCSIDRNEWYLLDSHVGDSQFQHTMQKLIFDVDQLKWCRIFSFNITGPDNFNRYYGYVGPVEFYGIKAPVFLQHPSNKQNFHFWTIHYSLHFIMLLC